MKLEYTNGCICNSLTVDGIETVDIPINDFKKVLYQLIDRETDLGTLQSIMIELIEQQGEFEDLGHCSCCGDYITKYTLEL